MHLPDDHFVRIPHEVVQRRRPPGRRTPLYFFTLVQNGGGISKRCFTLVISLANLSRPHHFENASKLNIIHLISYSTYSQVIAKSFFGFFRKIFLLERRSSIKKRFGCVTQIQKMLSVISCYFLCNYNDLSIQGQFDSH